MACFLLVGVTTTVAQTIETPQKADASTLKTYHYITQQQRIKWVEDNTFGAATLTVGMFSAGIGTARDKPVEYGPHWDGFGKRYGMRLTGVSTGNVIEGVLGDLWGEDPRYFRTINLSLAGRLKNIALMTVATRRRDGGVGPAYARYVSTPANNFLSNTWRADSEANNSAAVERTVFGFLGCMSKNAFFEFWPDISRHVFGRRGNPLPSMGPRP